MNTPKTPTDNLYRVLRGGSWYYATAANVRAAYRGVSAPSVCGNIVGFRCAQRGVRMPR